MQFFCLCRLSRQTSLVMKLTAYLLMAVFLQASANSNVQNITISETNLTVKKVFSRIKSQTDNVFFYDTGLLKEAHPVTAKLSNATLQRAMDDVCIDQPIIWVLENKSISLVEKNKPYAKERSVINSAKTAILVKGIVTDENNNSLEGVSVMIKGTSVGVVTNIKGQYSIDAGINDILVFSRVGYITQEIVVKELKAIDVKMALEIAKEEEVIVASTGYQKISKERATGSYDLVSKSQLEKPATNIGSRLVGQVAGMQATMDADGNPSFQVRGKTSLYANDKPLIVVDGFAIQGDFNAINPNDVESVTVLKDAAAASIWGARSANGVIVVTTKKAKKGTPLKIDVNVFTRVGQKMDLDYVNPLASSAETVDFEKMIFSKSWSPFINTGSLNSNYYYQNSQATTALYENSFGFLSDADMNNVLNRLKTLNNQDQVSKYLLSNPINTQINLNLYGGSERMTNNLSLLYNKNQTNFKESENTRYIINYRTTANVFKWLDFTFSGYLQMNDSLRNGATLSELKNLSPYDMLLDDNGQYTNITQYYWPVIERQVPKSKFPYANWGYNPIQEIRNRKLSSKQLQIRVQAGLTFKILNGLSFDSKIQFEKATTDFRNFYNDSSFYVRSRVNQAATWNTTSNTITPNLPKGGILAQSKLDIEAYNFRNQLNFTRRFGEMQEITFVAGTEVNNMITQATIYPTAYGYNDETLTVGNFPNGPGGTFYPIKDWLGQNQTFSYTNVFGYRTDRYFSYYGNLAYTLKRKYTISGSARTDASNLISDDPKYRYAPFWSVGGGWNVTHEAFMKPIKWVDDLRLRFTYGYNGNVDNTTAFMPLIAMASSPNVYTNDYTASISSYGNPTLRWEKTGTWNVGMDFSLFSAKLFGKVDVYNKKGRDLIATLSIPSVNGTTSQKLNNAAMTNRGVELTLGTITNIKGDDIVWEGHVNFSYNKNKITKLFVASYRASNLYGGGSAAYVVGKDAYTLWAFQYAGIRQTDKEPTVKGAGTNIYDFTGFTPGDGRDYLLDMGTRIAPYSMGFTNRFKIYNFDFSFLITGKFGHVFNRESFNYPFLSSGRVLPNDKLSEVINANPDKIIPMPLNDNEPRFYFWDRFYPYMSYLAVSASYIRMQEINLTYKLPQKLLHGLRMNSNVSLYAQANNLFTILANKYGEDPEYPKGTIKPQPQFTFGAQLIF